MIRVGIVGCGRILNAHLQGYKALRYAGIDDFQITALTARRAADARMFIAPGVGPPPRPAVPPPESGDPLAAPQTYLSDFQEDVAVQVYTDYRRMIAEAPIDAVNDFTSVDMHHQVGAAALQRGKHLLTQKPFTVSVKAGRQLVELAEAAGVSLGVFECVRQQLFTRAAGWAVKEGLIGQPHFAIIGSLGGFWSPDRVVADTPWRHRKLTAGGGGTIDIGVHGFHLLRYVLGEVEWVNAVTRTFEPVRYRRGPSGDIVETVRVDVDDTYLAVAGFARDAVAQMLWSWGGHGEPLAIPGTPAFYGSEGCIKGAELVYDDGGREKLLGRFEAELSAEDRDRFFPLGLTDPFALQQLDWLRSIRAGRDPETSGLEGLRDLACAFALLESSTLGRRVSLDDVLTGTVAAYQEDIDVHYGLG
ncbi:MAG: oxidoreductase [Planctomycetes bacterium SM23_65]|nr:MAG: oxidoreductase [Planctomycetes bacterium SM23_65]